MGEFRSDKYAYFANVRFDLQNPEDVQLHSDWDSWNSSVYDHLPKSSLGFSSSQTGSDILKVLDKFLDINPGFLCGPVIHILSARSPNDIVIDNLVARLRATHAVVRVIIPIISSGGLYPQTMYNLATRTNGFGYFAQNYVRAYIAGSHMEIFDYDPYQVYAVNVNVSGSGLMTLPNLSLPYYTYYDFAVTLQDSGILSTFQRMSLNITNPYASYAMLVNRNDYRTADNTTNYADPQIYMLPGTYAVTYEYHYSDSRMQTLQIRISSITRTYYWIPYAS